MTPIEYDLVFDCPECGGRCFGTSGPPSEGLGADFSEWIGHCHGDDGDSSSGCGFTWPRKDDWKYFKLVGTQGFESDAEYQARDEVT